MKRSTVAAAAVLAVLAGPAFAQSSITTESSRTVTMPAPVPPPDPPAVVVVPGSTAPVAPPSSYESHSVTHSSDGFDSKTTRSDEYVSPDGSSMKRSKTIERDSR